MGRQAYLTRLALGRSPFEEPELTESGEFILGSHAHDLDNQAGGYAQQFDDKGHPEHKVAKIAAKEFRRAKNDVLETIGVVVKKEKLECKRRKTTEKDKVAALLRENSYGPWLKAVDFGFTFLSLWCLMSLQRRFQTFKSFSSLPLLEIIKSEIRLLGSLKFFYSGLLGGVTTLLLSFCRQSLVEIAVDSIIQRLTNGAENAVSRRSYATQAHILRRILDFSLFAISAPVLMFSDLQMLHLIPPLSTPSLSSLIPFTRNSPIHMPHLPRSLTTIDVLRAGANILRSPIIILWLYDRGRHAIEALTHRVARKTVPRPDLPDKLSKIAAHKGDEDEDAIPGLWLQDGPTLFQEIEYEVHNIFAWFQSWKFWGREKSRLQRLEEPIRRQSLAIEHEILFGPTTAYRPRPSESMAREIRRHAARLSWESYRQLPPDDIDAWIGLPQTPQANSTNTPELTQLFTFFGASFDQEIGSDELPLQGMIADPMSLEARLPENQPGRLPSDPNFVESHNTDTLAHGQIRNAQPDTAFPANNSDVFWQYYLHNFRANFTASDGHLQMWENPASHTIPPLVRRARRLTNEVSSSRSFSRSQSRAPHPLDTRDWTREFPRHHVTSLSNYPADAFAYHMSLVSTTLMMLPLESLYLRALARDFLESPMARPRAIAAAARIRTDVRSLGAWFGGDEKGLMGRLQYASTMMLIWGMQCVLNAGIWGVGTRVAIWIGRMGFGWGRD